MSNIIQLDIKMKDLEFLFKKTNNINLMIKLKDGKIYEFDKKTKKITLAEIPEIEIDLKTLKQLFSPSTSTNIIFQTKDKKLVEYNSKTKTLKHLENLK